MREVHNDFIMSSGKVKQTKEVEPFITPSMPEFRFGRQLTSVNSSDVILSINSSVISLTICR